MGPPVSQQENEGRKSRRKITTLNASNKLKPSSDYCLQRSSCHLKSEQSFLHSLLKSTSMLKIFLKLLYEVSTSNVL